MYEDVSGIIMECINLFLEGKVDGVKVIYNHYVNTLTQITSIKKMLPIDRKDIPCKSYATVAVKENARNA